MTVDMSIDFCGVKFKNPFLLGSAPPTMSGKAIKAAAKAGWAGAITWPHGFENIPLLSVYSSIPHSITRRSDLFAFGNTGGAALSKLGDMRFFEKEMKTAKEAGIPIIASILADEPSHLSEMTNSRERLGADIIEVNLSCPFVEKIGLSGRLIEEMVKAAKEGCSTPIMLKLPPAMPSLMLVELVKAIERSGAEAISATNTIMGLTGIDVETGIPIPTLIDRENNPMSLFSGISGPALKPISLGVVAQIAKTVKMPISGIGGIVDWRDAVEYLMAGATTVQCATGPMVYGYKVVGSMINGLKKFMERKGYNSVYDFRGIALDFLSSPGDLKLEQPAKANIDVEKCTGCGICVTACSTGGNDAISLEEGKAAVNKMRCRSCNLCTHVCPERAISYPIANISSVSDSMVKI